MRILVYITFHEHYEFFQKCLNSVLKSYDLGLFDLKIINTKPTSESVSFLNENTPLGIDIIHYSGNLINIVNEVYKRFLGLYDYIMRVDSDDFLVSNSIFKLVDYAQIDRNANAICGGWNQIDHKGRFLGGFMHPNMHSSLGVHGACTLFKCSSLLKLDLKSIGINCQDGYASYIYLKSLNIDYIKTLDDIIFNYRRHNSNISSSEDRLWDNRKKILDFFCTKYGHHKYIDIVVTIIVICR